jgi:hypothetical protein
MRSARVSSVIRCFNYSNIGHLIQPGINEQAPALKVDNIKIPPNESPPKDYAIILQFPGYIVNNK